MTTTIITGASSGMGLFAAVELAGRGHRVIGTMRNAASAGRLNEAATAAGVTVEVRELDVAAPDAAERVAAIEAELGGIDNAKRTASAGPYAAQLDAYLSRTATAFANAQTAADAGRAIADAATSEEYRFRWQTSDAARAFASLSIADLDGSRVSGMTSTWIRPAGS